MACPQSTGYKSTNPGSGVIDPKTGDTWNSGTGDLTGCYLSSTCGGSDASSCNGDYRVTIIPESGFDCDDYDTARIDIEPRASFAMRRYPGDSDCSAGSGRFQLVPVRRIDRDDDGSMSVYLLPVQVGGTGVMTAKADVTAISKVSGPSGITLRVLKPDMEVGFSSSDALVNAATKSFSITGQHSFSAGDVAGNPAFVLEEIAEANFDDTQVDLTWSCGSSGTSVSRPQGYSFDLDDIGCTDAIGRMTLRVPSSPNRVEWEQYGNANGSYVSPTTNVNGTKAFSITYGDFFVDGAVLSTSGSQAQLRFDNIEWLGVDVCTAGTYTFGVE